MRIAVLADIHGNLPALEAVIKHAARHRADLTINLGDCISGSLWPRETCELLMSLSWPTVRGNCDREVGEMGRKELEDFDALAWDETNSGQKHWLATLPPLIDMVDGVLACHGTPSDDCDYLIDDIVGGQLSAPSPSVISKRLGPCKADVILCGHSHVPRSCRSSDGRLVINPGSVGLPAYHSEFEGVTYVAEAGSPHARYAVITRRADGWDTEHFAVTYDWERAAVMAIKNGRPDHAIALRTGTMRD